MSEPDAYPFSMLAVSALEGQLQTVEIWGQKYAAMRYDAEQPTPILVFGRGLIGFNDHQDMVIRNSRDMKGGVVLRSGDLVVLRSVTEYDVIRVDQSESLFSLMPDLPESTIEQRMARIADWHQPNSEAGGMTTGQCREDAWSHPCPTHHWATTDRDVLKCWDPTDDAEAGEA